MQFTPYKFLAIFLLTCVLSYFYSLIIIYFYKFIGGSDASLKETRSVHVKSTQDLEVWLFYFQLLLWKLFLEAYFALGFLVYSANFFSWFI